MAAIGNTRRISIDAIHFLEYLLNYFTSSLMTLLFPEFARHRGG